MQARMKMFGHAVHPILVVFPLGLFVTAVAFDILWLVTDRGNFAVASAFAIVAGLIGAAPAAVFGFLDWRAVPSGTRAKHVGLWHGSTNAVVLVLFGVSFALRAGAPDWEPPGMAVLLGFAGAALGGVGGWLGGELVERLGVGVDDGAHLEAPSSLSHREATDDGAGGRRTPSRAGRA